MNLEMAMRPRIEPSDVILSVTPLSFDIAALELYLPLMCGARVVVAGRAAGADSDAIRGPIA